MTKLTLQPTEFPMNCPILEGNNFKVILSNILHFKKLRAQGVRNMSTGYEEHNQNQPPHQTWDLGHEAHRGSCLHCQRTTEFKGQAWLPEAWTKNHVRLFFFLSKESLLVSNVQPLVWYLVWFLGQMGAVNKIIQPFIIIQMSSNTEINNNKKC